MRNEIRYFSMFTGVGGFELGLENTRNKSNLQRRWIENSRSIQSLQSKGSESSNETIPLSCVGCSEIDKYASELLNQKFPNIKNWGDCTRINPRELPDFDMLCGGFPCQSFSVAGKRKGFEDTRGTMFFEIARILEVKRPRLVFLENVKGLLNHEGGKTFTKIIQTLEELGYSVQWMVLNSKFFGVPQNRERVFIIGSLRGERRPEILPFSRNVREVNEEHKEARQIIQVDDVARENKHKLGDRLKEDGATFTLNSIEQRGIIDGSAIYDDYNQRMRTDGIAGTLTQNTGSKAERNGQKLVDGISIRRLTPRECERLQGFPDNWTNIKTNNGKIMSDSQRYKMMGNAVTVNVVKAIGQKLK